MPEQTAASEQDVGFLVLSGDPRRLCGIPDRSVHLAVTVPPRWPIRASSSAAMVFGAGLDYRPFLAELGRVIEEIFRVLVPGGRMVCIAPDIWLSRRRHGRHRLLPFSADVSLLCRDIGFDHLTPIIWHRPPARRSPSFFGKPYEPNGGIRSDATFILMQRKPGGYRRPTPLQRRHSRIERDRYRQWFRQMWTTARVDDPVESLPVEIAERLIRMFSYWGDTVLDPFCGSGTVLAAALKCHRNGVGVEADPEVCRIAVNRVHEASNPLFNRIRLECRPLSDLAEADFFPPRP
jgi:site-specific DNA-methyltransferase (adenine-specific)